MLNPETSVPESHPIAYLICTRCGPRPFTFPIRVFASAIIVRDGTYVLAASHLSVSKTKLYEKRKRRVSVDRRRQDRLSWRKRYAGRLGTSEESIALAITRHVVTAVARNNNNNSHRA